MLTGPKKSIAYFEEIDDFIGKTLGKEAQSKYQIVVDDPVKVGQIMKQGMTEVKAYRKEHGDAYQYQWALTIEPEFQLPFEPTHKLMAELNLHKNQDSAALAANLRKAFSGIVAGNVKSDTIKLIQQHGVFELHGDKDIMALLDNLLGAFVSQQRMKLPGSAYVPCYKVVK